jgi:hypothetical protein
VADLFSAGLDKEILNAVPVDEYNFIKSTVQSVIEGVYKYRTSALGIMENITADYSALDFDATEIQQKIGDPNNLELLRSILTKLG